MNLLFTADFQVTVSRLGRSREVIDRLLEVVASRDIGAVIFLGDMKEAFNPVDYRVIRFCCDVSEEISAKVPFYCLLGNHDRIGSFDGAQNFLPLMEKHGARIIAEPCIEKLGPWKLHFLPHCYDAKELREAAKKLALSAGKGSILCFHNQVIGGMSNNLAAIKDAPTPRELFMGKYACCIGGDVHKPQVVSGYDEASIMYVGSPYSMDWSEVNQKKRFLILDERRKEPRSVLVGLPGHYDPDLPGFEKSRPADMKGSIVRVRVPCTRSSGVATKLAAAKVRAAAAYPGADVMTVAEFDAGVEDRPEVSLDDGDDALINDYVNQTSPEDSPYRPESIAAYVRSFVRQVGAGSRGSAFRILRIFGKNVLSYEAIDAEVPEGEIILVGGVNEGWDGRSNGAGKTNALQIPSVALFGRTLKGQKADAWARHDTEGECYAGLDFLLPDGRRGTVLRERRPKPRLKLIINGRDISSGRGPSQTQQDVEAITGLTWESVKSVVYLDHAEMFTFLYGTNRERHEVVARLQNIERFEDARKLARLKVDSSKAEVAEIETRISVISERLSTLQESHDNGDAKEDLTKAAAALADAESVLQSADEKLSFFRTRSLRAKEKAGEKEKEITGLRAKQLTLDLLISERNEAVKLIGKNCPACGQQVTKAQAAQHSAEVERLNAVSQKESRSLKEQQRSLDEERAAFMREAADFLKQREELVATCNSMRAAADRCRRLLGEAEGKAQRAAWDKLREDRAKADLAIAKRALAAAQEFVGFFESCERVLQRDGLPGYVTSMIYPKLNRAAKRYSDMLTGGLIQTRFEVVEDGIVPVIVNASGGPELNDQSVGERQLAALAASFALREVSSPCNILIMDEPGMGLDPISAKQFAEAILKLAGRFGTIFLVTHNSDMESVLSGHVKRWTAVKKDGVSTLVEG